MLETKLFPLLSSYCPYFDMFYLDALSVCKFYMMHLLFSYSLLLCDPVFRKHNSYLLFYHLSCFHCCVSLWRRSCKALQHDWQTISICTFTVWHLQSGQLLNNFRNSWCFITAKPNQNALRSSFAIVHSIKVCTAMLYCHQSCWI